MSDDAELELEEEHSLAYRNSALVRGVLEYLLEAGKTGWLEVVDTFTSERFAVKTVENTLYDLTAFGAIRRHGRPAGRGQHGDTRALELTGLGRYWLEGRTPPTLQGVPT